MTMHSKELEESIQRLAYELEEWLVTVRRHLHMNPELSRQEYQTTEYLATLLEKEGIPVRRWNDCTGLIAEVHGKRSAPRIALRSELDGVGVPDQKTAPYASKVPNVMHACGHDLHATILMGVAITCHRLKEYLEGCVRFIFQPAEEVVPGGSLDMIKKRAMENVDAIVGFHSDPFIAMGKIGLKKGALTAGADIFDIEIIGKSGHTARPHDSKDTILCAAMVIDSLHQLVDREIDPREPFVLTIGQIHGGYAPNAIPERAEMSGTVRMLRRETQNRMPALIERVVRGITESMGVSYEFRYHRGSPPVENDHQLIDLIERVAVNGCGTEGIVEMEQSMGGEDFSWYLDHAPGAMVRIGSTSEGNGPGLHSNVFDVDERVIPLAVNLFSRVAFSYLAGKDSTGG
jgi:amidohydrolase